MTKMICIFAFALGFSLSASAKHEGKGPHHHGPCAKDVETLCAGIEGGHGAVVKCLKENETKLSAECSTHMKEAKEAMKEVHEACHEDTEKFCHDVKKGGGRIIRCMKSHKDELSAACKEEIEKKKADRKKRH